MKRTLKIFILTLVLTLPQKAHAQMAVLDAAVAALGTLSYVEQVVYYAQNVAQFAMQLYNTYEQLQNMIRAEERAFNNLKSVVDVRSFSDFQKWHNRQLSLEREVESRYNNLGIKIGAKTYRAKDIDAIPDAMRNTFGDPFKDDFTEEERMQMYTSLGLSPANYMYVKTWQKREEDIAKRIRGYGEIYEEEAEEAAKRNQNIINKYRQSNVYLDEKEILMETHITAMNTEQLLREIARLQVEIAERELARDSLEKTPPTPPRLSAHWNDDPFERITEGRGKEKDSRW